MGASLQGSVIDKVAMLKAALADRRILDDEIKQLDAADWVKVFGPKTQQPLLAPSASSRGGSRSTRGRKPKGQPVNSADLAIRPMPVAIPTNVPKVISNRIAWDVVKTRVPLTLTASINEANYAYSFTTHPQQTSYAALYDQWCLPQFSLTWYCTAPPGGTLNSPELHTALDFDNSTNLGNLQAIDDFDNARIDVLVPQRYVTRSVRPSMKDTTTGGTSCARQWCDSGSPSTTWFGIRSAINSTAANTTIVLEITLWYAFRNRI